METGHAAGSAYAVASEITLAAPLTSTIRDERVRSPRSLAAPLRGSWLETLRRAKRRIKGFLFDRLPSSVLSWVVLKKMPRSAQVEVTTACNLRCPLCVTHSVKRATRFLRASVVENLVRGCGRRLKVVNLHLLGEPLLHRELFSFIRLCSARGVATTFSTNGMLIDRHLDEIVDSGLTHLSVAIDGANAEDYERYRIGGDLERVVQNVQALLSKRAERGVSHPTIQVQTVMFSYNEDKEVELRTFLDGIGADVVSLKRPSYVAAPSSSVAAFLAQVDHQNQERRFARVTKDEDGLYRNRRMCPQLERANVLSDGRVVACCMDASGDGEFGNLNESTFARIWRGKAHREVLEKFRRREFGPCATCTLGGTQ